MKYALVTGAGSGLGRASSEALAETGFFVFAADINIDIIDQTDRIFPLVMDVTNDESVAAAIKIIKERTDRLAVVANFAGVVNIGALIENDVSAMGRVIEVGLLGTMRVNQVTFALLERDRGRIINISSEYGTLDTVPFHVYYTAMKHALEVYSDGLRREIDKFGVKVVKIRPGAFQTAMQQGVQSQFDALLKATELYEKPLKKMEKLMVAELLKAHPVSKFVKTFIKAATTKKPRRTYEVGRSFKMRLLSALPTSVQDWLFRLFMR